MSVFRRQSIYVLLGINILFISCLCIFSSGKHPNKEYKLHYPGYFGPKAQRTIDNLEKPIVELGRFLFYDKRLSGSNNTSCASCHIQEFAFSDNKQFSIGEEGPTSRNSMSLTNLLWQDKFFWDGRSKTLEEQALIPIQNKTEMDQNLDSLILELKAIPMYSKLFMKAYGSEEITTAKIARAIAQFEKILISSDSKFDQFLSGDTTVLDSKEKNGYKLFMSVPNPSQGIRGAACGACHKSPFFLSYTYQNNGLDSVFIDLGLGSITHNRLDNGKFKVPSLRNIALTSPYMHDGRFSGLKEVLYHYNSNVINSHTLASFLQGTSNSKEAKSLGLTDDEIDNIIAFLNTLSDQTLVSKKEYSNPF